MRRVVSVLFVALVSVMVTGVTLVYYLQSNPQENFERNVTLESEGVTEETFEFSALDLKPGDVIEYKINLNNATEDLYEVSLVFTEEKDGGLKEYVDVELQCGNRKVSKKLKALFEDSNPVKFDCKVGSGEIPVVYVRYIMQESVGNEAQDATADFKIVLTAATSK